MLQLLLSALYNPFRRGYAWALIISLIALAAFSAGYWLIQPPKSFASRPPTLAIQADSGCEGPWTVYAGAGNKDNFIIAVVADTEEPLSYASKFEEILANPQTSDPYAPFNKMTHHCGVMDIAVVAPKGSTLIPLGAVFGGGDIQNANIGNFLEEDFNPYFDADAEIEKLIASEKERALKNADGSIAFLTPTLDENQIGYVAMREDKTALEVLAADAEDGPYSMRTRPFWNECAEEAGEAAPTPLACAFRLRATPRPSPYLGPHLTRMCLPSDEEKSAGVGFCDDPIEAVSVGGNDYDVAPVAILFELKCSECKAGNQNGLSIATAFGGYYPLGLKDFRGEFSYSPISTPNFQATPWKSDSTPRTSSVGNWSTKRNIGYRSDLIDSYVWNPTSTAERRQFQITLGSILMGLGLTLIAEILIVSLHPGVKLSLGDELPNEKATPTTQSEPAEKDKPAPTEASATTSSAEDPESDVLNLTGETETDLADTSEQSASEDETKSGDSDEKSRND
ncbi:hypothetical protein [Hyphomonas atlantica corrig.]|uniref:hypothetical protein n=1 Tax=Hyphomonas atlantica TaxID=1280948 RepID=UPI0023580027|nr:hypothetical protein [Hyphomonas atlantica]